MAGSPAAGVHDADGMVKCLYVIDAQKRRSNWKKMDGWMLVDELRLNYHLLDDTPEPLEALNGAHLRQYKLTKKVRSKLESFGWLGAERTEEDITEEFELKVNERTILFIYPKPSDKRPSSRRLAMKMATAASHTAAPMRKYRPPKMTINSRAPLSGVPALNRLRADRPAVESNTAPKQRRRLTDEQDENDAWNDDEFYGNTLERRSDDSKHDLCDATSSAVSPHRLTRSTSSSFTLRLRPATTKHDEYSRAVAMAREEVAKSRNMSDRDVLFAAARQAATRAPDIVDEPPATPDESSFPVNNDADEPEDERTAAEIADSWLQEKTRSIEVTYDACWIPSKKHLRQVESVGRTVFEGEQADEENTEPLRNVLLDKLGVKAMNRAERTSFADLVDLVLDPTLFSYRLARSVIDNAKNLPYSQFYNVLDSLTPGKYASRHLIDDARANLRHAQDGSIVAQLRAHERPDENIQPQSSEGSALAERSVAADEDDFFFG